MRECDDTDKDAPCGAPRRKDETLDWCWKHITQGGEVEALVQTSSLPHPSIPKSWLTKQVDETLSQPGFDEKNLANLSGIPSHAFASSGASPFWVMFGQALAYSALIFSH